MRKYIIKLFTLSNIVPFEKNNQELNHPLLTLSFR